MKKNNHRFPIKEKTNKLVFFHNFTKILDNLIYILYNIFIKKEREINIDE